MTHFPLYDCWLVTFTSLFISVFYSPFIISYNFIKNNLSCGDKMEPPLTVINPLWDNLINLIGHKKLNSHVLDDVPLCCY